MKIFLPNSSLWWMMFWSRLRRKYSSTGNSHPGISTSRMRTELWRNAMRNTSLLSILHWTEDWNSTEKFFSVFFHRAFPSRKFFSVFFHRAFPFRKFCVFLKKNIQLLFQILQYFFKYIKDFSLIYGNLKILKNIFKFIIINIFHTSFIKFNFSKINSRK